MRSSTAAEIATVLLSSSDVTTVERWTAADRTPTTSLLATPIPFRQVTDLNDDVARSSTTIGEEEESGACSEALYRVELLSSSAAAALSSHHSQSAVASSPLLSESTERWSRCIDLVCDAVGGPSLFLLLLHAAGSMWERRPEEMEMQQQQAEKEGSAAATQFHLWKSTVRALCSPSPRLVWIACAWKLSSFLQGLNLASMGSEGDDAGGVGGGLDDAPAAAAAESLSSSTFGGIFVTSYAESEAAVLPSSSLHGVTGGSSVVDSRSFFHSQTRAEVERIQRRVCALHIAALEADGAAGILALPSPPLLTDFRLLRTNSSFRVVKGNSGDMNHEPHQHERSLPWLVRSHGVCVVQITSNNDDDVDDDDDDGPTKESSSPLFVLGVLVAPHRGGAAQQPTHVALLSECALWELRDQLTSDASSSSSSLPSSPAALAASLFEYNTEQSEKRRVTRLFSVLTSASSSASSAASLGRRGATVGSAASWMDHLKSMKAAAAASGGVEMMNGSGTKSAIVAVDEDDSPMTMLQLDETQPLPTSAESRSLTFAQLSAASDSQTMRLIANVTATSRRLLSATGDNGDVLAHRLALLAMLLVQYSLPRRYAVVFSETALPLLTSFLSDRVVSPNCHEDRVIAMLLALSMTCYHEIGAAMAIAKCLELRVTSVRRTASKAKEVPGWWRVVERTVATHSGWLLPLLAPEVSSILSATLRKLHTPRLVTLKRRRSNDSDATVSIHSSEEQLLAHPLSSSQRKGKGSKRTSSDMASLPLSTSSRVPTTLSAAVTPMQSTSNGAKGAGTELRAGEGSGVSSGGQRRHLIKETELDFSFASRRRQHHCTLEEDEEGIPTTIGPPTRRKAAAQATLSNDRVTRSEAEANNRHSSQPTPRRVEPRDGEAETHWSLRSYGSGWLSNGDGETQRFEDEEEEGFDRASCDDAELACQTGKLTNFRLWDYLLR